MKWTKANRPRPSTSREASAMLYYKTFEHETARDWVVFVHGAGGSSAVWYKQLRAFREHYNLLLVDLRGHGRSASGEVGRRAYTFEELVDDIVEVLDHLRICTAHFVGLSLGTVLIQLLARRVPERVASMVLAGAITQLNMLTRFFIAMGHLGKHILPFRWLYVMFAWVVLPKRHHREARSLFIRLSRKLPQREMLRWYNLSKVLHTLLAKLAAKAATVPTLYLMGEEDYLFLPVTRALAQQQPNSSLHVIAKTGHVCNVEQPIAFNAVALAFLAKVRR